ncbi:hypothetical protein VKS41_004944 [Umbelopsis sp. WA50703]
MRTLVTVGLVPPRCQEMDKQLARVKANLDACETPLSKFVFVTALQDRNETLFYRLLIDHLEGLAGIYLPYYRNSILSTDVQEACLFCKISETMSAMVYNLNPQDEVDVIVVTDGSRVLGLGDLGANGMQIPIGKLSLYVAAGGIRPKAILPVVLDVGTNNEKLLHDPLYLGMGHPRLENEDYYEFVDGVVTAAVSGWPRKKSSPDNIKGNVFLNAAGFRCAYSIPGLGIKATICSTNGKVHREEAHSMYLESGSAWLDSFQWTDRKGYLASGSPFKDVTLPNTMCTEPNPRNNSYSFPGLGLGITVSRATKVTPNMFLETAKTIAELATPAQLKEGILFPSVA